MGIARNFQQVRLVRGLSVVENIMIGCHARIDRRSARQHGGVSWQLGGAEAPHVTSARSYSSLVGMAGKAERHPRS